MLDIMRRRAAVGTDVEVCILLDSALVRAQESTQYPDLSCARVERSFLVNSFLELLIGGGRGTPVLTFLDVDFIPLKQVLACLPLR